MHYYDEILAKVSGDIPTTDEVDKNLAWFRGLTQTQQVVFSTHYLCCEVYNGGFHQYFHNSTGLTAPEAVEGFRVLGLGVLASLVEEAMGVFGSDFPREREVRQQFLDSIQGDEPEQWNPFLLLDDRFYEMIRLPGAPPLSDDDRLSRAIEQLVGSAAS